MDKLLNQYIDLADAYYQLADLAARATYQAAIQLAQRTNAPKEKIVHIMHSMGDIDVSRLDLREAMRTYEQIRKLIPTTSAPAALVDLNYRLDNPVSAVRELDGLLRIYAKQRRANPDHSGVGGAGDATQDMALRSRLAAVYRQTGSVNKAVEHLETLAELRLESGLHNDAVVTIRRIIGLNPEQAGDYQRLLRQLSG